MRSIWAGIPWVLCAAAAAWAGEPAAPPAAPTAGVQCVQELIDASGVKAGLCVLLGGTGGDLAPALARSGKFLVHELERDLALVEKVREALVTAGLYGPATVEVWREPVRLPYEDHLVNLVVVGNPEDIRDLPFSEIQRVLCPGGAALLAKSPAAKAALETSGVTGREESGAWYRVRKPRPPEMDEWTHLNHGPDGNAVSKDLRVGPPTRLQWVEEPRWPRRGHSLIIPGWASAGGRIFYRIDEAPSDVEGPPRFVLAARDAFNGLLLWKKPVKPKIFPPPLVAIGDRLYTVVDEKITALDAATGEVLRTYEGMEGPPTPAGVSKESKERSDFTNVLQVEGRLIFMLGNRLYGVGPIYAVEPDTGKILWKYGSGGWNVVAGDGKIFFLATGKRPYEMGCLELATGKELWRKSVETSSNKFMSPPYLCFYKEGIIVLADLGGGGTSAVSAENGEHLWRYKYPLVRHGGSPVNVFYTGALVWVPAAREKGGYATGWEGIDPRTGEVKKHIDYPKGTRFNQRCHADRATERFFITGTLDMLERETEKYTPVRVTRGGCGSGVLPANGLLYTPPQECGCDNKTNLRGLMAFSAARTTTPDSGKSEGTEPPLEKGAAFKTAAPPAKPASADEWPTYRHDPARSGSTAAALPAALALLWAAEAGGRLTAPVAAAGLVLVAREDAHQVLAFDAATGTSRWRFTAGGRVDTPPTIFEGLVLFGAADGWVYCLRAVDGQLSWRLRAAPEERRMMAYGRLESPWPVHGSVLVEKGAACFVAGRSSLLEGGIRLFGIEPRTGKVLWKTAPEGVGFSDLLSSSDKVVALRGMHFDIATGAKTNPGPEAAIRPGAGYMDNASTRNGFWLRGNQTPAMVADSGCAASVRNGYWEQGNIGGQWLVFRGRRTCGVSQFEDPGSTHTPGKGRVSLFSSGGKDAPGWRVSIPLRPLALLMAGDRSIVGGSLDAEVDPKGEDPWAIFEGRKGGVLWVASSANGSKVAEYPLSAPPVFDGLAAAYGCLYISTGDGKLLCFGEKK